MEFEIIDQAKKAQEVSAACCVSDIWNVVTEG